MLLSGGNRERTPEKLNRHGQRTRLECQDRLQSGSVLFCCPSSSGLVVWSRSMPCTRSHMLPREVHSTRRDGTQSLRAVESELPRFIRFRYIERRWRTWSDLSGICESERLQRDTYSSVGLSHRWHLADQPTERKLSFIGRN